jgi:hypothetical protein
LPTLLAEAGLVVTHLAPLVKACRPADPLWHWPTEFFGIYVPKLVAMGHLTAAQAEAYFAEWRSLSGDPGSVFITPTLMEIVARKPG